MKGIYDMLLLFMGALGFALLFNVKKKNLILSATGGTLAFGIYLLLGIYIDGIAFRYYMAGVFLGLYSEICARMFKLPATIPLVVGFIPLIPGYSLYYTMHYLIREDMDMVMVYGLETWIIAATLATGIISAGAIFHTIRKVIILYRRNYKIRDINRRKDYV